MWYININHINILTTYTTIFIKQRLFSENNTLYGNVTYEHGNDACVKHR